MARIQQAHYDFSLRQNRPPMTEAGRDFTLGMQALKPVAQPDDIADAVSPSARWINGESVRVDGGSKL